MVCARSGTFILVEMARWHLMENARSPASMSSGQFSSAVRRSRDESGEIGDSTTSTGSGLAVGTSAAANNAGGRGGGEEGGGGERHSASQRVCSVLIVRVLLC